MAAPAGPPPPAGEYATPGPLCPGLPAAPLAGSGPNLPPPPLAGPLAPLPLVAPLVAGPTAGTDSGHQPRRRVPDGSGDGPTPLRPPQTRPAAGPPPTPHRHQPHPGPGRPLE